MTPTTLLLIVQPSTAGRCRICLQAEASVGRDGYIRVPVPTAPTNLQVLKRSRRRPAAGDVFVMLPPDDRYLVGRVIRNDVLGPASATLIYIYADRRDSKRAPVVLDQTALLIPPVITNALGWDNGIFETVDHRPITGGETLARHCFFAAGRYYDEDLNPLPARVEPCGVGGVMSYRMLDDLVSDALRIARVPEQP